MDRTGQPNKVGITAHQVPSVYHLRPLVLVHGPSHGPRRAPASRSPSGSTTRLRSGSGPGNFLRASAWCLRNTGISAGQADAGRPRAGLSPPSSGAGQFPAEGSVDGQGTGSQPPMKRFRPARYPKTAASEPTTRNSTPGRGEGARGLVQLAHHERSRWSPARSPRPASCPTGARLCARPVCAA